MNFTVADTVEQRAIELVSNLGREHLFVANCPSDIDADKHASKIITYEEAFDHCDAGVGSCLLLPKALVLRKLIDHSINKDISVHFVLLVPVVPAQSFAGLSMKMTMSVFDYDWQAPSSRRGTS